ncbi:helix-turn-helix transcriptional regulator [Phreatobacter sp. AB_2022a]|uniref:helix-turn-helix transcriptional regulator n=1 Tax=Phreatobacter sp. AB_2022a TaxID=3003134 RepID=UPI0022873452|nr:helix-turn-helix domain-containing protein [Phreatobacter sp. AB_2022a]MCZ0734585.1 helix-turn-helix domain-containing protein [Phreatobacter sp. AB_2022a]
MLTSSEAAQFLGKSTSWLNQSRMRGDGPVFYKIGAAVRYDEADLRAWLATRRRTGVYAHANDNARAKAA